MPKIVPTVGRRIWYKPTDAETEVFLCNSDQPFDAGVVYVHVDGNVNLVVTSHGGEQFFREDVPISEDSDWPEAGTAYWMPYQLKAAQG